MRSVHMFSQQPKRSIEQRQRELNPDSESLNNSQLELVGMTPKMIDKFLLDNAPSAPSSGYMQEFSLA